MGLTGDEVRAWFESAGEGFVAAVTQVGDDAWARPGLGEWDVRALVGHTSRAFLTVESYLVVPSGDPASDAALSDGPVLRPITVVDYYARARQTAAGPDVAARGRAAGAALGPVPLDEVRAIRDRVVALVADSPDDAPVRSPFGDLELIDYLQTRAFELTVHGLDLVRALGIEAPEGLRAAVPPALVLAARLTVDVGGGATLLALLTGRPAGAPLPRIV